MTVVQTDGNQYSADTIAETITGTNLGDLKIGDNVNLERSMPVNSRFDGHVVQGMSTKWEYVKT